MSAKDDSREKSDTIHKLRAENRLLRKRLAAADKLFRRMGPGDDLDEEPADENLPIETPGKKKCPQCAWNVEIIPMGIFTLHKCESCSYRARIKNPKEFLG